MTAAYIGLGGNQGDPRGAFRFAISELEKAPATQVAAVSSLYRTAPWGKTDQPDFLNAVVALTTALAPQELLAVCMEIERKLKRVRKERWGPRPIDLDILWHGGRTVDLPDLKVPHPRMMERAFVLVPLAEIAPGLDLGPATAAEAARRLDATGVSLDPASEHWWK